MMRVPDDVPSLFDGPPTADEASVPLWVSETPAAARWWTFHVNHPSVATALVRLARRLLAQGHRRIGIAMLWETMRYSTMLGASPDEDAFRLNNNHRAYYARWIMEQHDDLRGVFQTRELHPPNEGNDDVKDEDEIEAEMDKATDTRVKNNGRSLWSGMTYEQGVQAALRWALDEDDEETSPMEDA